MHRPRFWIPAWCALVLPGLPVWGADGGTGSKPAPSASASTADVRALAATIDRLIAAGWETARTQPAPPADDAEFLRRLTLDIAGRIPTVTEARELIDDPAPDKRARAVERMLASPSYSAHMRDVWKGLLLPEETSNFQLQIVGTDFDAWLRKRFADNAGYDELVREIVTAPIRTGDNNRGVLAGIGQNPPSPYAFFVAKDAKPENLAASTARVFLGIRLECAQCHDHPFATWKRDQFWSYAAFFASIERVGNSDSPFQVREVNDRRELSVSGTQRVVQASFLDGTEPQWRAKANAREVLADWMTAPENPYFARAAANRLWAQFFGTGLVEPIDDMAAGNLPSHPELLDTLARELAAHHFDFKFLIRAITASRAYQLTSAGYVPGQDDSQLFARKAIRGMSPRQLYESIVQAGGLRREQDQPYFIRGDSSRKEFLDKFAGQEEKATEHQTSILQALTLMNGRLLNEAVSLEQGGTLPAVADASFLDTPAKIETLYLAALGRRPRPEELAKLVPYVDQGGPTLDPKNALADAFWALLNSAEFVLNH